MLIKSRYRNVAVGTVCHHEYAAVKSVISVWHGSLTLKWHCKCHSVVTEFRTFGAIMQNARLTILVCVHGTERRGASVDRRDRVVTWCCRSSSMYGGTEVERALCMMTAILYWMRC